MSIKKLFCDNWLFSKQNADASINDIDNIDWQPADIPHDWLIWQTKDLYESSNGFYKKKFVLTGNEPCLSLRFEGVYMNSTIYINGKEAFEWKYGYSTFEFEITDFVHEGENEIIVLVRHHAPNSRWYSGAGIFRPVYMITREKTHFISDGIYFSAFKSNDLWNAEISSEINNPDNKTLSVKHTIINKNGDILCDSNTGDISSKVLINGINPQLWDIENPVTYILKSELFENGILMDTETCTIGFRQTEFSPEKGFLLNGRKVKFNGVCLHHDLGALGAAVNKTALKRQLVSMLDMGVNAVRTSHNMPAKELMELSDELGILVLSEAFDMWQLPKTKYDYARFFDGWAERDAASWIRRDRNHPSVIMWSIGNEIYDTHAKKEALEVTKMLNECVLQHDPNRNGYATIGSNYIFWEGAQKCTDVLKLSGYNYGENAYTEHHEKFPDWFIYGSETAARVHSRGIYHFPESAAVITYEDMQCSSLENSRSGLGDRTVQYPLKCERDIPFSGGQFIWTGSDYLGEPSPYWTKNSYYGAIDTAGFRKDNYYLYQTMWKKDAKVLHLFPYWDFNDGQLIDVLAYTAFPRVELFLNGISQGISEVDVKNGDKLNCQWLVPYQKGIIKAVAYDADGNIAATDEQSSFGDGVKIILEADKYTMKADGEDLVFITISTADEDNVFVANAKSRMNVSVSGAGRLVGLDSGDSTDYDEFKGNSKKLFSGMLLAIIAATTEAGEVNVNVSSKGFLAETLTINAVLAEVKQGVSCITESFISSVNDEIPVRKIELKAERIILNKKHKTTEVTAVCYPYNCDTPKLIWKAVTDSGIETNIAEIEANGNKAVVSAVGDGEFRLRCTCANGKEFPEVISDLEFKISGVGDAVFTPYNLIPASLYNASNFILDNDLEGGVKAKTDMTYIGFKNVDFGNDGSNKITIPIIHWHTNNPLPIEVWKGIPDEDNSECLFKGEYNADFIWQTYQENTFTLSENLTGIQTICIAVKQIEQHVSIKGFYFEKRNKAYERLSALSNSRIFGDTFEINHNKGIIKHIGNNVSIEFDSMDFSNSFNSLTIRGKTHNDLDSIHVIFKDDNSSERRLVEFEKSDKMIQKTFALEGFKGIYKVTFWFLPGCNFDFEWFIFN